MRNQLNLGGKFIQGHMYEGGDFTPISGTLTSSSPSVTLTMDDEEVFVTVLIYTAGDSDGYVGFTIDGNYAGYCSAYTTDGMWNSLSFPMMRGQKLKLTAAKISSGITYRYLVHKQWYKQD